MGKVLVSMLVLGATLQAAPAQEDDERPLVEAFLHAGLLAEGEAALQVALTAHPEDDQLHFGLGTLRFLRAIENLAQQLHRYGLDPETGRNLGVPFLRLPVPPATAPERLTYAAARGMLAGLLADLRSAESALARVADPAVRLPLRMASVRLDFDGSGSGEISLSRLIEDFAAGRSLGLDPELDIAFDRGDASWMRGYCHLLMALCEIGLAFDTRELFERTAHAFFANVDSPHAWVSRPRAGREPGLWDWDELRDAVAFVHLLSLPLAEPERLAAALVHLEQTLALSGETWQHIQAEADDDREWLPNAQQHSVIGARVTQDMIDAWLDFVAQGRAVLAGECLVPFWRGRDEEGVNLRRVFTEPRPFDLLLWFQGTDALPYLEHGPRADPEIWERLLDVFQGRFMRFAAWFN